MKHFICREEIEEARKALKCGVKAALREIQPGAAVYARVEGGYVAFDTCADHETWKNQR